MGRRGPRVPRLPLRDLGHERRALPPGGRRGGARAGGTAHAHRQPLLQRAGRARWPARLVESLAGRRRVLHQLGRRGQRGGDQARPQAAARRRHRLGARRLPRPHLRRAERDAAGEPSRRRSRRWCRGSARSRPDALPDAVDERTAAVLVEPIQGESGVHAARRRGAARDARGLRRRRGAADLRRGPDRDGAHRHAVVLRAPRRPRPTR